MKARLEWILKQCKIAKHVVLETVTGESLAGIEYEPLFNYYIEKKETKCFTVITATYVTTDAGTGIVH
jgi:isoleucyl-tRNA synthetase